MNGRILIVDDVATNRIVYRAWLAAAFYEPMLAATGQDCLDMARAGKPDLILLDLSLPDMMGNEVLKRLRTAPATRNLPVIVLTAARDEAARLEAFAAGADDVLTKPVHEPILLARLRNLLRSRGDAGISVNEQLQPAGLDEAAQSFEPRAMIALVASRSETLLGWQFELQQQTRDTVVILSRTQALADISQDGGPTPTADVFIINDDFGGSNGSLRLLSELKSNAPTRHSSVVVVNPPEDQQGATMAFDLGADDAIDPAISGRELALRVRSLLRRKRHADRQRASVQNNLRLAMIDPLTGLHNRRYALPKLEAIALQADREGEDFAVMVVDLDNFKLLNDRFGHAAGDQVLVDVAQRLTSNLRMTDVLARIGGEEFLIALPRTAMHEARRVAERLCRAIEERPVRLGSGVSVCATVSIGVSVSRPGPDRAGNVETVIEEADLALLDAKTSGRNRVTFRLSVA